jgi:TfoX/Sxy family transcriptional regulator of competence genes
VTEIFMSQVLRHTFGQDFIMAYDEGLAERIRDIVRSRTDITERRMFGGLAIMSRGHMFVGVLGSTLMARIGQSGYADALSMPHVRQMDFTGKPMKGYVFVEPEGFESDHALEYWVNRSYDFAASLPPKPAKR